MATVPNSRSYRTTGKFSRGRSAYRDIRGSTSQSESQEGRGLWLWVIFAVAENLIHSGFQNLQRINPKEKVYAHAIGIEDEVALSVLIQSDWIMLVTDNHFSRYKSQEIALQLGVPLISTGVNSSVENQQITDMRGEIITALYGDKLCLNCLGRINLTYVAAEQHKNQFVGDELIRRGHVTGEDIKEPAVKILNSIVGAMAVNILLHQYAQRQEHKPVLIYENNKNTSIYEDNESLANRQKGCFLCC